MSRDAFARLEIPRLNGHDDDRVRERARQGGHAAGYADGMRAAVRDAAQEADRVASERLRTDAAARDAVAAAVRAVESAAAALRAHADALAAAGEQRVFALAIDLAESILGRELSDPTRAAQVAAARIARSTADDDTATPVAFVSPADAATLAASGAAPLGVALRTSADLAPGEAIVRMPDGEIDLRVTAAIARARAAVQHTPEQTPEQTPERASERAS